jgi:hypothetical protein
MEYMMGIGICNVIGGGGGAAKPDGAPFNLVLTVDSDSQISGVFESTSTNQDGYEVAISTDGTTYTLKTTVTGLSFVASSLTQATIYYLKVRAYRGTQYSSYCTAVFQLTLATAFVGGVANTKRYVLDDVSLITKDVNNYITAATEKYGSGETLVPLGTYYPEWTAVGMKTKSYTGGNISVLTKNFTLVQSLELYMLIKLPTWSSGAIFIGGGTGGGVGIKQFGTTPNVQGSGGIGSSQMAASLDNWHVVYMCLSTVYGKDVFGVDLTEEINKVIGDGNANGLSLGGHVSGLNGCIGALINETVVRNAISSDADRAGIVRYLMNKAAFFLA